MSVALSFSVYSERPAMQPPVCSSTSHVLAPFRRWASANIDALHEADGKTKQNKKAADGRFASSCQSQQRPLGGSSITQQLSVFARQSLSLSAPPPQMHLGIQCRLIPLTSEDPCADTLRARAVKIIIIIKKNSKLGETKQKREKKNTF